MFVALYPSVEACPYIFVVSCKLSLLYCSSRVQVDLDQISRWCGEWQLALNVETCKVMQMCRRKTPIMCEFNISWVLFDSCVN